MAYDDTARETFKRTLPDGGGRIEFEGGAIREPATGKGRYDLVPPKPMLRLAQHYENGAKKYKERNWETGMPADRCFDSTIRHMNQYLDGNTDEDHLAAAVWNIFTIMHMEEVLPQFVNLPNRPQYKYTIPKEVEEKAPCGHYTQDGRPAITFCSINHPDYKRMFCYRCGAHGTRDELIG